MKDAKDDKIEYVTTTLHLLSIHKPSKCSGACLVVAVRVDEEGYNLIGGPGQRGITTAVPEKFDRVGVLKRVKSKVSILVGNPNDLHLYIFEIFPGLRLVENVRLDDDIDGEVSERNLVANRGRRG